VRTPRNDNRIFAAHEFERVTVDTRTPVGFTVSKNRCSRSAGHPEILRGDAQVGINVEGLHRPIARIDAQDASRNRREEKEIADRGRRGGMRIAGQLDLPFLTPRILSRPQTTIRSLCPAKAKPMTVSAEISGAEVQLPTLCCHFGAITSFRRSHRKKNRVAIDRRRKGLRISSEHPRPRRRKGPDDILRPAATAKSGEREDDKRSWRLLHWGHHWVVATS